MLLRMVCWRLSNTYGREAEAATALAHVTCLPTRQDESERAALGVAAGMELGDEAASRSARRLGLLSPLFMPNAQWCARTIVLERRYRRKTLFHLPYSAGGRRHCAPVRANHIIPSK
jgi:hypothetical protein